MSTMAQKPSLTRELLQSSILIKEIGVTENLIDKEPTYDDIMEIELLYNLHSQGLERWLIG